MSNTKLLAKSSGAKTLVDHTREVIEATEAIFGRFGHPTRIGNSWLRFFGLQAEKFDKFLKHLRVSAAAHDLGKANEGFQSAVRQTGEQLIRHEVLSVFLLSEIEQTLIDAGLDSGVCLSSVAGHHLKAGDQTFGSLLQGDRTTVRVLTDLPDFAEVWSLVGQEAGANLPAPRLPSLLRDSDIDRRTRKVRDRLRREKSLLRIDPDRRRFLSAVRAGLIVADAVGSAVLRLGQSIPSWVAGVSQTILTPREIQDSVIGPRIEQLRAKGRWEGFSGFQEGTAMQGPRVLLTTPCGSGKTLAAWRWIKAQAGSIPCSRVLFLYPTRATATEGFRDYVSWAPEADASLVSGTADYELEGLFANPDDDRHGRDYRVDPRLFALGLWSKRIFSATADQFFPFLQYRYGPSCLLPLLAESVIVVDEVHSFDQSMFNTLKRFLHEFPTVPVLAMTATLSARRRAELAKCGLQSYPDKPIEDLAEVAEEPRYVVEWIAQDQVGRVLAESRRDGNRILRVVNTVARCQEEFARHKADLCYHSRYRLSDRRDRHTEAVRALHRDARGPLLAVATQVCEMSLDIYPDVLVADVAPIASLIQRLGRCNRAWPFPKGQLGRVFVIRPEEGKELPYTREELNLAVAFVDSLVGRPVSQADLERAYERFDPGAVEVNKYCPFLDSGPFAEGGEENFRDIEDFTVPCVLDSDRIAVIEALHSRRPIDGWICPVPKRLVSQDRPADSVWPRWLGVAPASHYSPATGFQGTPQGVEQAAAGKTRQRIFSYECQSQSSDPVRG